MRKLFPTICPLLCLLFADSVQAQLPLDKDWPANAVLEEARPLTIDDIGACQGVSLLHNKLYFYGDRNDVSPRIGVIHEYTIDFKPTGRILQLNKNGKPILTHPTGIAYLDKNNVYLGNTVNQKAKIFLLDWEQAWKDGNLNRSIKNEIDDDLAVNGCRPITINFGGQRLIATADYGWTRNEIRLYDPAKLVTASKTSETGVLKRKFSCGSFNQNLDWDEEKGQLICIQNVVAGRGWRLQFVDLEQALQSKNALSQAALKKQLVFPAHTELEGFRVLPNGKMIFTTAHKKNNVWIGTPVTIVPRISKRGQALPFFNK